MAAMAPLAAEGPFKDTSFSQARKTSAWGHRSHLCFPWLTMHAADVLNKFRVGADGKTAYERIKGRAYSGLMLEFGACILYKTSARVQGGDMSARWEKGIWERTTAC